MRGAKVVMASCEVPQAATRAAFTHARNGGALTLLNPAPAQPLHDELLALCDLLTPNESELRVLAGLALDAAPLAAARGLLARGAGAVAVTLGAPVLAVAAVGTVAAVGVGMLAEYAWDNWVPEDVTEAVDEGLRDFGEGVADAAGDVKDAAGDALDAVTPW